MGRKLVQHRQNPYDLARGEIPLGVIEGGSDVFLLTSRRIYRYQGKVNATGHAAMAFIPVEIERPQTRPPRIRKAKP